MTFPLETIPISDLYSVNAQELLDSSQAIQEEKNRRLVDSTSPQVISYEIVDASYMPYFPPGSVTAIVANSSESILNDLAAAIRQTDRRLLTQLVETINHQYQSRSPLTLGEATEALIACNCYGELRYGSKTILPLIALPLGMPFALAQIPYTGGSIDQQQFTLIQYHQADSTNNLEALLIIHKPSLTEAEASALQLVPDDLREIHIGETTAFLPTVAYAVLIAAAWYFTFATPMDMDSLLDSLNQSHLSDDRIRELGAIPSVRELLALRSKLLLGPIDS
jgi:hypothetical protein